MTSFTLVASLTILPGYAATDAPTPEPTASPTATATETPAPVNPVKRKVAKYNNKLPFFQQTAFSKTFSEHTFSFKQADSVWVLVNKARPLNPINYEPKVEKPRFKKNSISNPKSYKLRADAAAAISKLDAQLFKETGMRITLNSAYRSFDSQLAMHNFMMKKFGKIKGENIAAREGYSEHQTGLAADLTPVAVNCKKCTRAGGYKWLADNSWKFGFILRYPSGKSKVTGYQYEPWHFRYVGQMLAEEYHYLGAKTLEEFFGAGSAPGYDTVPTDPPYFY